MHLAISLYWTPCVYDDHISVTPHDLAAVVRGVDHIGADQLLHHEVEGRVDELVEEVEELGNQRAELVDELVIKMVKEVTEVTERMEALTKSLTSPRSSLKPAMQRTLIDSMSFLAMEPATIQSDVLKAGMLTDEAIRNGSLKKSTKKRGNSEEPSRDGNVRDDNKRSRIGRAFDSTTNLLGRSTRGGQGHGNNGNQARGRVFVMGAEEASQDPNIVMGTFTLNNHYAITLFNFGVDYSFVSTTFIPLLDIEPSKLDFSYEIEIASEHLVEINKVIRGMDWLSKFCLEEVVRIPLPNRKILRVLGERPEEKAKHLMSVKVEGQKLKDIVVVRNFFEIFPDNLSGLPPSREIKFCFDVIPGAMPVAKSPYRLAPSEMEELSSQLRELQDKGFIRPSSSP
ncbi:hypothetical protein Tco_0518959 [Tanacetum coccineum]